MKLYQGDVQLFDADIPEDAEELDTLVVRSGEGHNVHVLENAKLFRAGGVLYVRPSGPGAAIVHRAVGGGVGEHFVIPVERTKRVGGGTYEWDVWANEGRRVED